MAKELYRIGLVRHLFFKCVKMSLRWVFSVKTAVILLKGRGAINFIQSALAKVLGKSLSIKYYRCVHNMFHVA